jgi:hypothetical protein
MCCHWELDSRRRNIRIHLVFWQVVLGMRMGRCCIWWSPASSYYGIVLQFIFLDLWVAVGSNCFGLLGSLRWMRWSYGLFSGNLGGPWRDMEKCLGGCPLFLRGSVCVGVVVEVVYSSLSIYMMRRPLRQNFTVRLLKSQIIGLSELN